VGALHDFHAGMVPVDLPAQVVRGRAVGFRQENIGSPPQVVDGLPEETPREDPAVPEGVGAVHEDEVQAALQGHVLETVVEQEGVDPEVPDRVLTGLHPVLVDEHAYPGQVARQHVGLVAGFLGPEEDLLAIADDLRGRGGPVGEGAPGAHGEGIAPALVATGEDGHVASLLPQAAGKLLDDRCLPGPPHGEVAHDHDEATEGTVAEQPDAVGVLAHPHDGGKEMRASAENQAGGPGEVAPSPVIDHVDEELLHGLPALLQAAAGRGHREWWTGGRRKSAGAAGREGTQESGRTMPLGSRARSRVAASRRPSSRTTSRRVLFSAKAFFATRAALS